MDARQLNVLRVQRDRQRGANALAIRRAALRGDRAVCALLAARERLQEAAFWTAVRTPAGKVA